MPEYDQKEKEYYETLKLPEGASAADIKKQYHKLARELHSDVNAAGNEDDFKKINHAYEKLTNPVEIKAREGAKRRAAAEEAKEVKAEAARRAAEAKAKAAREQRERSTKDSEMFGERLRGQTTGQGAPNEPPWTTIPPSFFSPSPFSGQPQEPTPTSQTWHAVPNPPKESVSPVRPLGALAGLLTKLSILVAAIAFAATPFGIMYLWIPVFNKNQQNLLVDLVGLGLGIGCIAWICAGCVLVLNALGGLFSDW